MIEVTRFGSNRKAKLNLEDYRIDWEKRDDVSRPQTLVKDFLYPYWKSHVVTWETRIPSSLLRVDIINWTRHIAVEVSPKGSHSYNPHFHKGSKAVFGAAMKREMGKTEWLEKNGFIVCEIFDEDFAVLSPKWFLDTYGVTL